MSENLNTEKIREVKIKRKNLKFDLKIGLYEFNR